MKPVGWMVHGRTHDGASWPQGDWNGDGVFDSSDLVTAFADGGYEKGIEARGCSGGAGAGRAGAVAAGYRTVVDYTMRLVTDTRVKMFKIRRLILEGPIDRKR